MLTYSVAEGTGRNKFVQKWRILTLFPDRQIQTEPIDGPSLPEGVFAVQIARVGELVVAYGGKTLCSGYRTGLSQGTLATYSILTGEWVTVDDKRDQEIAKAVGPTGWKFSDLTDRGGKNPVPRDMPLVFGTDDCLVVCGGLDNDGETLTDTWEWYPATQTWKRTGDSPIPLFSFMQ
eukprot:g16429.t1